MFVLEPLAINRIILSQTAVRIYKISLDIFALRCCAFAVVDNNIKIQSNSQSVAITALSVVAVIAIIAAVILLILVIKLRTGAITHVLVN